MQLKDRALREREREKYQPGDQVLIYNGTTKQYQGPVTVMKAHPGDTYTISWLADGEQARHKAHVTFLKKYYDSLIFDRGLPKATDLSSYGSNIPAVAETRSLPQLTSEIARLQRVVNIPRNESKSSRTVPQNDAPAETRAVAQYVPRHTTTVSEQPVHNTPESITRTHAHANTEDSPAETGGRYNLRPRRVPMNTALAQIFTMDI
jgi:hypothetical protein